LLQATRTLRTNLTIHRNNGHIAPYTRRSLGRIIRITSSEKSANEPNY
jgi:hypothetical protein